MNRNLEKFSLMIKPNLETNIINKTNKINYKKDKKLEVTEPIVSQPQIIEDTLIIRLLYIASKGYYWLIEDKTNNEEDYCYICNDTPPEKLENSEAIRKSSIYNFLRMNLVIKINQMNINGIKIIETEETLENDIFYKQIGYIADVLYGFEKNLLSELEPNGKFKNIIEDGKKFIHNEDKKELIEKLKYNYSKRKNIGKCNLDLSLVLTDYLKIDKQHITHLLYKLHEESNGYNSIDIDTIHENINNLIGRNLVNKKDLETALSHIPAKLKPEYNIIKFNNCIYDYKNFEFVEPDKPIFSIVEINHDYHKNEYITIDDFLNSSLWQGNKESTEKYVLGVKEIIGYLFCSGNQDEVMIFIVGVPGSGKSTLINLITNIFGGKSKVSDMKPQDTEKNVHVTAGLLGKHLNIMRDIDSKPVENIGILKQMRGYDDLDVYPKGRDTVTIPKEEVPKNLLVANRMPIFRNADDAFQETAIFIEFKHKFRGTDKEKDYNKGFPDSEVEGLIVDCMKAYEKKKINNNPFILQEDLEKNKLKFEMHSKPYHYLVNQLVQHDTNIKDFDGEDKVYSDDLNKKCIDLAKMEGLSIDITTDGTIKGSRISKAIKDVFDLHDYKWNGRSYGTFNDGSRDDKKRYYPELYKKQELWDKLDEKNY